MIDGTKSQSVPRGSGRRGAADRTVRVPQQARSRRTRESILEAAIDCFEARGYDDTTTASIAERAGIGVGTLYGYFRDKRGILLELLDQHVRAFAIVIVQQLEPDSWRGTDPRDHVRAIIDVVFHSQTMSPGIQRILWERYFKDDEFREPFDAIRGTIRDAILGFIDAVADDPASAGLLRELDRESAAAVVLNAVQWNATQAVMRAEPEQVDAAAAAVSDMVSRYLFR